MTKSAKSPKRSRSIVACASVIVLLSLVVACSAQAAQPWWNLASGARPSYLPPEGKGEVYLTVENVGDASAEGTKTPVKVTDVLPAGLEATEIAAGQTIGTGLNSQARVPCVLATLTCEMSKELPPFDEIEVRIAVKVKPGAASGEENEATVSGGGAAQAAVSRPITVSPEPVPFAVEEYGFRNEEEGGEAATGAASHPFQQTTTITVDQRRDEESLSAPNDKPLVDPSGIAKDTSFRWPPGLVGDPASFPVCTALQFSVLPEGLTNVNACPESSAVGVAVVTSTTDVLGTATFTVPVFNIEPGFGEPARFGFFVPSADLPVYINPVLRSGNGEDYGLSVNTTNITQIAGLISAKVTVWGTPGDVRHENSRGWGCLAATRGMAYEEGGPCESASPKPPAFLVMPARCEGSMAAPLYGDSWGEPFTLAALPQLAETSLPQQGACNRVPFAPTVKSEPTSNAATSASGLRFDLDFANPGLADPNSLAESEVKKTVVTLPEGFTSNPSVAEGLKACSRAEYEAEALGSQPGANCPDESKVGSVEITSPLIAPNAQNEAPKVLGSLFVAKQAENPYGNLLTFYLVARNQELGIIVKQALKVTPNPVTGQLTTEVDDIPQIPFSRLHLEFRPGQRAPLVTPAACGTYAVGAELYPWARPTEPVHRESSFQITTGAEGQGCPAGGLPPFHPSVEGGTLNNAAGVYSPFDARISRNDSEQEITHATITMPPGLSGNLTGIEKCSDTAIEEAKALEGVLGGGQREEEHPNCPVGSQIGHTLVGTGVGTVLAYAPGKLYLAGPYKGAPLSIVAITAAKIGPFDIGTVVVRFGLIINPITAQVEVNGEHSDPIPHILDGIVVHLRNIRVYADRPGFVFNPTSCEPMKITGTIGSANNITVAETARFQAADCANLAFKPVFKVSTSSKASRKLGASLTVKVTMPGALGSNANIHYVKVALPKQLPSNLKAIQHACPHQTFEANPASCSSISRVGYAKATTPILPVPLEGPAYFVSYGGLQFPELVLVLQGYGITIDLHGETFINEKTNVTTSTFHAVPDQPVNSFELNLPQGEYSALAAPGGKLCSETLTMPTLFEAQNGARLEQNTPIEVTGCPYALSIATRKVHKQTLTLKVLVPTAGKLVASGRGLSRAAKNANGRQTLTLTLKERHAGRLRSKVVVSFTPSAAAGRQRGKKAGTLRKTVIVTFP